MNTRPEDISHHFTAEDVGAMLVQGLPPTDDEIAALERLIEIANSDTGQSRRCADFLLSWWNAATCGGFDMTAMWGVDTAIARDMVIVFAMVARVHDYPNRGPFNYNREFSSLVAQWRDFD